MPIDFIWDGLAHSKEETLRRKEVICLIAEKENQEEKGVGRNSLLATQVLTKAMARVEAPCFSTGRVADPSTSPFAVLICSTSSSSPSQLVASSSHRQRPFIRNRRQSVQSRSGAHTIFLSAMIQLLKDTQI